MAAIVTGIPTSSPQLTKTVKPSQQPHAVESLSSPTMSPTLVKLPFFPEETTSPTVLPSKTPTTSTPTTSYPITTTLTPTKTPSTMTPTANPTLMPTKIPTHLPTQNPTQGPTKSQIPTNLPTLPPTRNPTMLPTLKPTQNPTRLPTRVPTKLPTLKPSQNPTRAPTPKPTARPTRNPTTETCDMIGNNAWSSLGSSKKEAAKGLGYNKCSWAYPPYNNDIEYKSWSRLTSNERDNAMLLDCDAFSWDRMMNHYSDYSWGELVLESLDVCAKELGYTPNTWAADIDPEAAMNWWDNFTDTEMLGAECLGYTEETWNNEYFCETDVDFTFANSLSDKNNCVMTERDGWGDRLDNSVALYQDQWICSRKGGGYMFGLNNMGQLILKDSNSGDKIKLYKGRYGEGHSWALSKDAEIIIYDKNEDEIWSIPSIADVHFYESCLTSTDPPYDCPYLHLHSDGVMVLNYIENGFDDDNFWIESNIKGQYDWGSNIWN